MKTRLSRCCDRAIEAGWLLAVVLVPVYFNVKTNHVFEADKGALLRGLAIVMVAAWLVKAIERAIYWLCGRLGWIERSKADRPRRSWLFYTLVALSVLFALVYLASALTSVHLPASLLGSYQRRQGTIFTLCLIAISLLIAAHLRTRAQIGRLLAAVTLGSLPVTLYAVVQSAGADPLPWGTPVTAATSTLGNPLLLAAYLAMAIPLTAAGLIALFPAAWHVLRHPGENLPAWVKALKAAGYGFLLLCGLPILGLQIYVLVITHARFASLALIAAAVPFALLLVVVPLRRTWGRWIPAGLAGLLILGILLRLTIVSFADIPLPELSIVPSTDVEHFSTLEARRLIWQGCRELFYTRPPAGGQPDPVQPLRHLLGYGPETLFFTYDQVYQPELGRYEGRTSTPDRAHNQLLDVGVNLGWAGVAVYWLLLAAFFAAAVAIVATARNSVEAIAAAGVLWAGLAHFIEAQFGIPIIPTRLLFWVGLGILAALASRRQVEPSAALPGQSLASGVALLLLPATALVAVTTAGFLHVLPEIAAPGIVIAIGLALAAATAALNLTIGWRKPGETSEHWQWLYPAATGLLVVLTLLLLAGAGLLTGVLAQALTEPFRGPPDHDAALLQAQAFPFLAWGAAVLGLLGAALSLPRPRAPLVAWSWRNLVAFAVASPAYALIAAGAVLLMLTNLRPIQADAVYKLALGFESARLQEQAADLHERAGELAPHEDFYYFELGRARLIQALQERNRNRQVAALTQAREALERASQLSPLNPDHPRGLAKVHQVMASLQTDPTAHHQTADGYYAAATTLAPYKVVLWNDWAAFYYYNLGDETGYQERIEHSLELDPYFEQTWMIVGSVRLAQGDQEGAIEALSRALELAPDAPSAWDIHYTMAIAYAQLGDLEKAQEEAQIALEMAPEEQKPVVERLIRQLQQQQ